MASACPQLEKSAEAYSGGAQPARTLSLAGQGMVGSSAAMQQVYALVRQVARSQATVLVTGRSGTGKELVARAIHELSPRSKGPFVAINCAALPESLIESELFGYERGAFTGAEARHAGCFELAHKGTLLLDEIGEMASRSQATLLRVVEDHQVRRLGGSADIAVDVRIVASSNVNLKESVRTRRFREDLYYRLNTFEIDLPTLRQRREDIPALIEHLIPGLNLTHGCSISGVSPDALVILRNHPWPGNVRELKNVLERAAILAGVGVIAAGHLGIGVAPATAPAVRLDDESCVRLSVGMTIDQVEHALIQMTYRRTQNKTAAARILGISTRTLDNRIAGAVS